MITPAGALEADVLIGGEQILAIHERRTAARAGAGEGEGQVIDATGCLVLPGGVDPHCHLMEDVRAATTAAALGGTTTVLSFTNPGDSEGALESLSRCRQQLALGGAMVDVGLHAMLYEPDHVDKDELRSIRGAGASAVKVFLAYPELGIMWSTRGLFDLMVAAQDLGLIVQVHCENGPLIEALIDAAVASNRRGPRCLAETRPPEVEAESAASTLAVASMTGATCYLVHLSSRDALDFVRLAKHRGTVRALAETCVHYLVLTDEEYDGDDAERYFVAPPLRPGVHGDALWTGIADGTVDTVGSDHCQVRSQTLQQLSPDQRGYDYGLAGVGARLPVLLSEGLARGVPIERLVEVGCTAPAKLFGHYPAKGVLSPGSDADVAIIETGSERVIGPGDFDDGTGDSPYTGRTLRVNMRSVISRGLVIVEEGELVTETAGGRYLPSSAAREG